MVAVYRADRSGYSYHSVMSANHAPIDFVAIDFETANSDPVSACAIGIAVVRAGQVAESFAQLIRPPYSGVPSNYFSEWNYRVHGIHWTAVEHQPTFAERWEGLRSLVHDAPYLVAHHAEFDAGVLDECLANSGLPALPKLFHCTLHAANVMWTLESYKLSRVCQFLKIPLTHHDAQSDASAAANVMIRALDAGYRPGDTTSADMWGQRTLSADIVQLIREIMDDGVVEREEIQGFDAWLVANPGAAALWPGTELAALTRKILADGVIKDDELLEFRGLCAMLLGLPAEKAAKRKAKRGAQISVCFTGFGTASRKDFLRGQAEEMGFHVTGTVTKTLDILVLGEDPGPAKLKLAAERSIRTMAATEWTAYASSTAAARVNSPAD
jgi:DNA polymerase III subunit epsilon